MYLRPSWRTADITGTQSPALTSNLNEAFQAAPLTATLGGRKCVLLLLGPLGPSIPNTRTLLSHYRTRLKAAKLKALYRVREVKGQTRGVTADVVQNKTKREMGAVDLVEIAALHTVMKNSCRECNCMFVIKVQLLYIAAGKFTFAIAKFSKYYQTGLCLQTKKILE